MRARAFTHQMNSLRTFLWEAIFVGLRRRNLWRRTLKTVATCLNVGPPLLRSSPRSRPSNHSAAMFAPNNSTRKASRLQPSGQDSTQKPGLRHPRRTGGGQRAVAGRRDARHAPKFFLEGKTDVEKPAPPSHRRYPAGESISKCLFKVFGRIGGGFMAASPRRGRGLRRAGRGRRGLHRLCEGKRTVCRRRPLPRRRRRTASCDPPGSAW